MPTVPRRPAARQHRDQLEARRLRAAELFAAGVRQAEVARQLGVSPQAVSVWHRCLKAVELANLTTATLGEVVDQAHRGIDRVRRTPHLAYSFLRHAGLSVCSLW